MKYILISAILFFIAQVLVWFQTFGQLKWEIFVKQSWIVYIFSIPITYIFIKATKLSFMGFGELWPTRFLIFAMGIFSFAILTYFVMGEPFKMKSIVSCILAMVIVLIQLFWK